MRGYTISHNERGTGGASIAAPFFDSVGNVLGSISASGPVFRYPGDHEARRTRRSSSRRPSRSPRRLRGAA